MKTVFIFLALFSVNLYANSDSKKAIYFPTNTSKKSETSPLVKVKINLSLSKGQNLLYSLVMPMKKENLSLLNGNFQKSRFDLKPSQQPRFKNMENVDLASIVESNKFYNIQKAIQVKTY